MSNPTHAEFIQGLRELAEFYEAHPELSLPDTRTMNLYYFAYSVADRITARDKMITAARAFGKATKKYAGEYFFLRKEFSGGVCLEANVNRETVCEPVVVGYTDEPEKVIPEQVVPARRVPRIEWACGKSLLAAALALGEGDPALQQPAGVELPEEGRLLEGGEKAGEEAFLQDSDIPF